MTPFDPAAASPTEVVREVWRRLEAGDYDGAAALHTDEFAEHAADWARREAMPRTRRHRTVDELLALSPEMPREVAEWEVEVSKRQPEPEPYFGGVYGIDSIEALEALTSRDIVTRRLKASDWRSWLRPHLDELAVRYPQYKAQLEKQRAEARSQWGGEAVGHVVRGGRARVIVEENRDAYAVGACDWAPRVVTLRETTLGWRISSDLTEGQGLVHFHIEVVDEDGNRVVLSQ